MSYILPTIQISLKTYIFNQSDNLFKPNSLSLFNCLIDTGTSDTIIKESKISNSFLKILNLSNKISISNCLGQSSNEAISKYTMCNVYIPCTKQELTNQKLLILNEISYDAIIGMDILHNLKLNFKTKNIVVNNVKPKNHVFAATKVIELRAYDEVNKFKYTFLANKECIIHSGQSLELPVKLVLLNERILNNKKYSKIDILPSLQLQTNLLLNNLNDENKAFETGFNQLFDQIYKIESNLLVNYESLTSNEKRVHNHELAL